MSIYSLGFILDSIIKWVFRQLGRVHFAEGNRVKYFNIGIEKPDNVFMIVLTFVSICATKL